MARPSIWFHRSDMIVDLSALRSSTMAAGSYLNDSGGVAATIYTALSTANSTDAIFTGSMDYVTGTDGEYRLIVQSTDHAMARGAVGMAVITVAHGGLNREWRPTFRVDYGRY